MRIIIYLIILLVSVNCFAQQRVKIRKQDISSIVKEIIEDAEYITQDSVYMAASNSLMSDKSRSRYTLDGAADDVQIATMISNAPDSSRLTFAPGLYSLADTDGDGFGILIRNREFVVIDMEGAIFNAEASANMEMMRIDSCDYVVIKGGRFWGNMDNQTSGIGIKIQDCDNVYVQGLTIDSTRTHGLPVFSCDNVFIDNYRSRASTAGRGFDGDWNVAGDAEGSNLQMSNLHIYDHGLSAIKIENYHNWRITNSTLVELSPGGGSIAALIIDNNDGAADTLQWGSVENCYIEGKIAIDNTSGPTQLVDCQMNNSWISIEGTGHDTQILGGAIFTKATDHNTVVSVASSATGRLTVGGGIQIRGTGAVSNAFNCQATDMIYRFGPMDVRDMGNRVFTFAAGADSIHVQGVNAWSLGGHGANELFADVSSDRNRFVDCNIYDFKRAFRFNSADYNEVFACHMIDATATADTAVSFLGSSDNNRLIYNTYENYTTEVAYASQADNLNIMGYGENINMSMYTNNEVRFYPGGQTSRFLRIADDGAKYYFNVDGTGTLYINENVAPYTDNTRWFGSATEKWKGAYWVIYSTDPGNDNNRLRLVNGTPDTLKIGDGYILFDSNDSGGGQ